MNGARRYISFTGFLLANAISLTGDVLALVAFPWFVLSTTHSATQTGLTASFQVLAIILSGIFSGVIIDRVGYKRASVLADITSGVGVAAVPLLYATVGLALWQLLALVFLSNFFNAPGAAARIALLPSVTRRTTVPLERSNAFLQAIQRGARLLGGPLAGVLIVVWNATGLLWIDALTFAVSALLIGLTAPASRGEQADEGEQQEARPQAGEGEVARAARPRGLASLAGTLKAYTRQIQEGYRFIYTDRLLLTIVLTVMISNFFESPTLVVVLPVYMQRLFGNSIDFGLAVAAFGGGALAGSFLYGLVSHRLRRRPTYIAAFILGSGPVWLLAAFPSLPVSLVAIVLMGFTSGPINPIIYTLYQERAPEGMRGRVLAASTSGTFLVIPLGTVVVGHFLDAIGLRLTLLALAGCYMLVTVSLLVNPVLHQMDARQQTAAVPALPAEGALEQSNPQGPDERMRSDG